MARNFHASISTSLRVLAWRVKSIALRALIVPGLLLSRSSLPLASASDMTYQGQLSFAAGMDRVQREWRRHRLSRRDEYSVHLPRWERALAHSSMSTRWVWAVRP